MVERAAVAERERKRRSGDDVAIDQHGQAAEPGGNDRRRHGDELGSADLAQHLEWIQHARRRGRWPAARLVACGSTLRRRRPCHAPPTRPPLRRRAPRQLRLLPWCCRCPFRPARASRRQAVRRPPCPPCMPLRTASFDIAGSKRISPVGRPTPTSIASTVAPATAANALTVDLPAAVGGEHRSSHVDGVLAHAGGSNPMIGSEDQRRRFAHRWARRALPLGNPRRHLVESGERAGRSQDVCRTSAHRISSGTIALRQAHQCVGEPRHGSSFHGSSSRIALPATSSSVVVATAAIAWLALPSSSR